MLTRISVYCFAGSSLIPMTPSRLRRDGSRALNWWEAVVPSTEVEAEQSSLKTSVPLSTLPLSNWSVFESMKLDVAVEIIINASSFLRLRAATKLHRAPDVGGIASAQALEELKSMCEVFVHCAEIAAAASSSSVTNSQSVPSDNGQLVPHSSADSVETLSSRQDFLHVRALTICENLVCVIHDSLKWLSPEQVNSIAPYLMKCDVATEDFPPQHFVRVVLRLAASQGNNSSLAYSNKGVSLRGPDANYAGLLPY